MCTVPGSLALRPPWRGTAAPFSGEETGAQSQDAEPGLPGLSGRATAPCSLPWSGPESVGNYRTEVLPFGFHVGGKKPKGTCGCRPGPAEASHSPVGTPEASPGLPGSPRQRPWNAPGGGRAATVLSGTFHPGTQHAQCPSQGLLSQDVRLRSAPSVSTTDPGTAATLSG